MPEPSFEITFQPQLDGRYLIAAHFRAPQHDDRAVATTPSTFDVLAMRQASDDPAAYGRALTDQVFADPTLRAFWGQCRAVAFQHGPFALRLRLGPSDDTLHALRWETLRDPEDDQPLALSQRLSTAYAIARLLGALGVSAAGEVAGLRDAIIAALADAINHEGSQREVVLYGEEGSKDELRGPLADTLYAELLRVAGWPG